MSEELHDIGNIENYYGCLTVKKEDGKFYWAIENWDGYAWEEISENLYIELLKHNDKENDLDDELDPACAYTGDTEGCQSCQ